MKNRKSNDLNDGASPESVSKNWVVFLNITLLAGFFVFLNQTKGFSFSIEKLCVASIIFYAIIYLIFDVIVNKTYLKSQLFDFSTNKGSLQRTFIKFIGFLGSCGFVGLLYWIFPEYQKEFYYPYWNFLSIIAPTSVAIAIIYIFFVDSYMVDPKDGYWHMGQFCFFNWHKVDWKILRQHVLGWLVKGFFLPLMFVYFFNDLRIFVNFDFSTIVDFRSFYNFIYDTIFLFDVCIVAVGYLLSLKLMDTHIRSVEFTFFGWVIALICYEPFWNMISQQYLNYETSGWGNFWTQNSWIYPLWGSIILFLFGIFVWSSMMFGCRFSNLTHRGIITNGPYRWSKHPAYIAKNMAWWMISLPIIFESTVASAIKKSCLLLILNFVYFLRARTEERHLSLDPVYQQYVSWISENGIFAKFKKHLRNK